MFKYIKAFNGNGNIDGRSVEEKVDDLRKMGISISVRNKNDKYEEGYILGKPDLNRMCK